MNLLARWPDFLRTEPRYAERVIYRDVATGRGHFITTGLAVLYHRWAAAQPGVPPEQVRTHLEVAGRSWLEEWARRRTAKIGGRKCKRITFWWCTELANGTLEMADGTVIWPLPAIPSGHAEFFETTVREFLAEHPEHIQGVSRVQWADGVGPIADKETLAAMIEWLLSRGLISPAWAAEHRLSVAKLPDR